MRLPSLFIAVFVVAVLCFVLYDMAVKAEAEEPILVNTEKMSLIWTGQIGDTKFYSVLMANGVYCVAAVEYARTVELECSFPRIIQLPEKRPETRL